MSDHGFGSDTPPPPPPPPPPKDEGAGGRGGAKDGADNPYEDAGGSPGQETAREETRAEDKSGNRSEDAAGDESGTLDQESPKPLPPSDEGVEDQGRPKEGADDPFDEDAHRSPVQETSEAAVDGAEDNDEVTDNDKAAAAAPDATETRTEDTETAPPATDPPTEGGPSPTEDDRPSSPPTEANRPSAAAEDDAQDPPEKKPDAPADTQQGDASTSPGDTDEPGPSETPDHIPEQRQDPDRTTRPEPDGEPASMDGATETVGEGPQSAETIEDADQVPGVPEPESVETDRSPEDPATTDAEQHTPPSRDVPQPADGAGDTGPDHSAESHPEGSQQPQPESGDPEGSVPGGSTDQPAAPAVETDGDAAGAGIAVGVEGLGKAAVATVEVAGKVAASLAMEIGAAASEAQADIKPDGGVASDGVPDEGGNLHEETSGDDAAVEEQPSLDEPVKAQDFVDEDHIDDGAEQAERDAVGESNQSDTNDEITPAVDTRISELETQGHGPQRHLHPSTEALKERKGEPKLDANGDAILKNNGHIKTENHVDPDPTASKTNSDGTPNKHFCGDYATKFISAQEYVYAEQVMRDKAYTTADPNPSATIDEVFGLGGHSEKFEGYYVDPNEPLNADGSVNYLPVDFHNGLIIARFNPETGDLITMYPDPNPERHP